MKTYTVKNYNGNIVESLVKFQNKYPRQRIVEAIAEDDELKVKTEAYHTTTDMNDFFNFGRYFVRLSSSFGNYASAKLLAQSIAKKYGEKVRVWYDDSNLNIDSDVIAISDDISTLKQIHYDAVGDDPNGYPEFNDCVYVLKKY